MCDPTFLVYAALTTAGTLYSTSQGQANADAQVEYQRRLFDRNKEIANAAAIQNYAALQRRQIEEHKAAAQTVAQVAGQAREARGTARTAAAEAGVGGVSVDALLADFERQELGHYTSVIRNQAARDAQFIDEGRAVQSNTEGRILSALPQPVTRPDFLGAALRIGGDLLGGFNDQTYYDKNSGGLAWKRSGRSVFGS